MKIKDLSLVQITLIQVSIAAIITLLYQFMLPIEFLPLDVYVITHDVPFDYGEPNEVIFTITQWSFGLSIAWLIYRDNKYVNNFLIYSVIPLILTFMGELIMFGLWWDYIHIIPLVVGFLIIFKKNNSLEQKYYYPISTIHVIWLYSVYFLRLAYYSEELWIYTVNIAIALTLNYIHSRRYKEGKNTSH